MTSNTTTLPNEIKKVLRSVNYPYFIGFCIVISFLTLLGVFAYHPEEMALGIIPMIKFTMGMAGMLVIFMIGMLVGIVIAQFYKPRVIQIINIPKDVEMLKDVAITLGSYVTTIGDSLNSKEIGRIFYYIIKQLKKNSELQEADHKKIEELEKTYMLEFQKVNKELIIERNLRKKSQENEKVATEKLVETTKELLDVKEELRKLKGE